MIKMQNFQNRQLSIRNSACHGPGMYKQYTIKKKKTVNPLNNWLLILPSLINYWLFFDSSV